jgi:hypothetical protein
VGNSDWGEQSQRLAIGRSLTLRAASSVCHSKAGCLFKAALIRPRPLAAGLRASLKTRTSLTEHRPNA